MVGREIWAIRRGHQFWKKKKPGSYSEFCEAVGKVAPLINVIQKCLIENDIATPCYPKRIKMISYGKRSEMSIQLSRPFSFSPVF